MAQEQGSVKKGDPGRIPGGRRDTSWKVALRRTLRQFTSILPIITGVVFLLGLARALLPPAILRQFFSGPPLLDAVKGAGLGSILAGNPINSYIIGGQLLSDGASIYAVTAFVLTWVTVGIVQLPAEAAALGTRFALTRNLIAFALSLPLAAVTVALLKVMEALP